MKRFKIVVAVISLMIFMSGCSTIYFHNKGKKSTKVTHAEWHHDAVYGLVEVSPPVDMKKRCKGKNWKTIKVEQCFLNGVTQMVLMNLYNPWTVGYSCR